MTGAIRSRSRSTISSTQAIAELVVDDQPAASTGVSRRFPPSRVALSHPQSRGEQAPIANGHLLRRAARDAFLQYAA
jgi:hypothetical protein